MKTNQIVIRPMGEFQVTQRTCDGFFCATELLAQWNQLSDNAKSIENFYIDNQSFLQDMNFHYCDNKENVYLPYHIFVVFANWLSPYLFIYAFNLCEDDNERIMDINRQIDDKGYSLLRNN